MLITPIKIQGKPCSFGNIKPSDNSVARYKAQNSSIDLNSPNAIYNRAMVNFKGNKEDKYSYMKFIKAANECGIKRMGHLVANIKPENLIGTGANSNVYVFSDKRLDNWVLKEDNDPFMRKSWALFTPTKDDFEGQNMGQEIARAGDRYRILKKIKGEPHSVKDWSYHIRTNSGVTKKEAWDFLNTLGEISEFPQESFDNYAKQLKYLDEKGYKQDSINPNNLIINSQTKEIHIIDAFKKDDISHMNTRYDLTSTLLDFSLYDLFYEKMDDEEKEQFTNYSKTIINKCKKAADKYKIPDDEMAYYNYLRNVDKFFGFYLLNKGGDYRSRYIKMRNILAPNQ